MTVLCERPMTVWRVYLLNFRIPDVNNSGHSLYSIYWQISATSTPALIITLLLGWIALAPAIPAIAKHFSVVWSVCRASVCQICAHCLNNSTDLDATRQVTLSSSMTHCVRKGRFGGCPPCSQNMQLQIAAATWWIEMRSDSAFSKITLDLLEKY